MYMCKENMVRYHKNTFIGIIEIKTMQCNVGHNSSQIKFNLK